MAYYDHPAYDDALRQAAQVAMRCLIRNVHQVKFHRNGCCGESFHVVDFTTRERPPQRLLGVVFKKSRYVAVLTPDDPLYTWRGDHYEAELREAVAAYEKAETEAYHARTAASQLP